MSLGLTDPYVMTVTRKGSCRPATWKKYYRQSQFGSVPLTVE